MNTEKPAQDQHQREAVIRKAFYRSLGVFLLFVLLAGGLAWYLSREDAAPELVE